MKQLLVHNVLTDSWIESKATSRSDPESITMYHSDYYNSNFGIRSEKLLTLYLQYPVSTKLLRVLEEMSFPNFLSLLILLIIEIAVSPIHATISAQYAFFIVLQSHVSLLTLGSSVPSHKARAWVRARRVLLSES